MNKREIILGIVIVLIIVLAIVVGINISKTKSKPTSTETSSNPKVNTTNTPDFGTDDPNIESPSPEPVETTSPEVSPSATPTTSQSTQNKDISKMTDNQKIEYAKSIAKSNWEKLKVQKKVFYDSSSNTNKNTEKYIIIVRDESDTRELAICEVDIKTGNCKLVESMY